MKIKCPYCDTLLEKNILQIHKETTCPNCAFYVIAEGYTFFRILYILFVLFSQFLIFKIVIVLGRNALFLSYCFMYIFFLLPISISLTLLQLKYIRKKNRSVKKIGKGKYHIRLMFEYGGFCLWSANSAARKKFGYPISLDKLDISPELSQLLHQMQKEYEERLNRNDPLATKPLTKEEEQSFHERTEHAADCLREELGKEFEVEIFN